MTPTVLVSNATAKRHYATMITCLQVVLDQIPVIEKLCKKMDPKLKARGFTMLPPDELLKLAATMRRKVADITDAAKKYETELISRDWTV